MKTGKILTIAAIILCYSCELDNYDAPDGSLTGNIIDAGTGELIQSDIIEGTTIKLIEHGYDPVTLQYLRVKNDGTYANTLLFSNKYTVQPDQRNFFQIDEQEVKIGKKTTLDFVVTPYLRIKDFSVTQEGNVIMARFKVETTSPDAVEKVGLYAHSQPIVGSPVNLDRKEMTLNRTVSPDEEFTVGLNLAKNTAVFKSGKSYYFRIGALNSVAGAKFNYAPAVRINIGELTPEELPEGKMFDDCEQLTGEWAGNNLSLSSESPQQGEYSIMSTTTNTTGVVVFYQKTCDVPFDTEVDRQNGYMSFWLYISDVSQLNFDAPGPQIEITSSSNPDQQELSWDFNRSLNLNNGWNRVVLSLAEGGDVGGTIDLSAVNFFRIFHTEVNATNLIMKIDDIRFFEDF